MEYDEKLMRSIALAMLAALVAIVAGIAAGFFVGRSCSRMPEPTAEVVRDTVYLEKWIRDTIVETKTEAAGEVVAVLPVATEVPQPPSVDRDTTAVAEAEPVEEQQAGEDSAAVVIPIERKTIEGEYYIATVEGYRPSLVSIDIRQPYMVVKETQTMTRRKWWSVTIGPQVGYGFTPAGWQPYAGIGATIGFSF